MLDASLSTFANALPIPVYIHDINGVYVDCNNRFALYMNKTKKEIIGRTINEIVDDCELINKVKTINQSLLKQKSSYEGQFSWAGHSIANTYKSFIVNKSILRNANNEVYGLIGTITDISNYNTFNHEMVKVHKELSQNGLTTNNLKTLNHEFRSPMNTIKGFTDILLDEETDIEKKNILKHIKRSNERLLNLIINILHLAEIESNDFYLRYEDIDMVQLINESIEQFKETASLKGISIVFDHSQYKVSTPMAQNRFALTIILANLIGNAIKFSEYTDVFVHLSSNKTKKYSYEIKVSDSGIGISSDKLSSIFEKFVQIEPIGKDYFTGAGLGLNIVKQLVEALGAEIEVKSTVGVGSLFTIKFNSP